ncbi:MAG: hypothetical protein AABY13_05695 [Nanoarchaeota archaeon]
MSNWLYDNLGYVALFAILAIVMLIIIGIIAGKLPDITDAIGSIFGVR